MKKHKNTTDSKKVKVLEEYPSAHIILESVKKEYDIENERSKTLDTRVSIFMLIAGVLLQIISQNKDLSQNTIKRIDSELDVLTYGTYKLLLIITYILIVISILLFTRIVTAKRYKRNKLEDFLNKQNSMTNPDIVAYELIKTYVKNIEENININDEKYKNYKYGIYCLLVAIMLFIFLYIISMYI